MVKEIEGEALGEKYQNFIPLLDRSKIKSAGACKRDTG
jgi:hypothetical protein